MVDISPQELDNRRLYAIDALRKSGIPKLMEDADLLEKTHHEQIKLRAEQAQTGSYVAPWTGKECIFRFENPSRPGTKLEYNCDICERQELEHMDKNRRH